MKRAPIERARVEHHIVERGRIDPAFASEQLAADLHRLRERTSCFLERGEHEIAKRMIAREFEAIFERFREGIIGVLCERGKTFADIAWWGDLCFSTQDAR